MAKSIASTPTSSIGVGYPRSMRWTMQFIHSILFRRDHFLYLFALILIAEFVLGCAIIQRIAYTEIDWIAYMDEVSGFLGGEFDYANLKGDTGPLVYPAGFVYLYSALYYATDGGNNILRAQYIFLAVYIAFTAVMLAIYHETKICPPWACLLLSCSRRIHSIFLLRCFNDCFAMLFVYIAIYLMLRKRWTWSCVVLSLALSIKMNVLLFMPAMGILLLQRFGFVRAISRLLLIVVIQIVLAIPFLVVAPRNYLIMAFDFSRAFFYVWTVNMKFVDESTFLNPQLAKGLLGLHVVLMIFFLHKMLDLGLPRYILVQYRLLCCSSSSQVAVPTARYHPSPAYIVALMFVMNLIGIACARSLHYQFYVWYYHTLPLLLWLIPVHNVVRILILLCIEYCWNVYPATASSSALLATCHVAMIVGLAISSKLPAAPTTMNVMPTKKVK